MNKKGLLAIIMAVLLMFATGCVDTPDSSSTEPEPAKETYVVIAKAKEHGTVTGGGTYEKDAMATLVAAADEDYELEGWYSYGDYVSSETQMSITVTENVAYYAVFRAQDAIEKEDYTSGRIKGASFAFNDRTEEDHNYDGLASLEEGTYFSGLQSDKKVNGSDNAYAIKIDAMDPEGTGTGRYPADEGWADWNRINNWLRLDLNFDKAKDLSASMISVDVYNDNFSYALGFAAADGEFGNDATASTGEKWLSLVADQNANGGPEAFLDYVMVTDIGNGWKRVQLNLAGMYENAAVLETVKVVRFIVSLQQYGVDTVNEHTLDYTQNSAVYFDNLNIIEVEEPAEAADITEKATSILKNATVTGQTSKAIVESKVFNAPQEVAYYTSDGQNDLVVTLPLGANLKVNAVSFFAYIYDEENLAPELNITLGETTDKTTVIGWKKVSSVKEGTTDKLVISFGKVNGFVMLAKPVYSANEQSIVYAGGEKTFGSETAATAETEYNTVIDELVLAEGVTKVNYTFTFNMSGTCSDDNNSQLRKVQLFATGGLWSAGGVMLGMRGDIMFVFAGNDWDNAIANTWGSITVPKGQDITLTVSVELKEASTVISLVKVGTEEKASWIVDRRIALGNKVVGAYCVQSAILTIK